MKSAKSAIFWHISPRKKWYFPEKVDPWDGTTCQLSGCHQQKAAKKVTFFQDPGKSDFFYRARLQKVEISLYLEGRLGYLGMAQGPPWQLSSWIRVSFLLKKGSRYGPWNSRAKMHVCPTFHEKLGSIWKILTTFPGVPKKMAESATFWTVFFKKSAGKCHFSWKRPFSWKRVYRVRLQKVGPGSNFTKIWRILVNFFRKVPLLVRTHRKRRKTGSQVEKSAFFLRFGRKKRVFFEKIDRKNGKRVRGPRPKTAKYSREKKPWNPVGGFSQDLVSEN